jgi:hypothetical protein
LCGAIKHSKCATTPGVRHEDVSRC